MENAHSTYNVRRNHNEIACNHYKYAQFRVCVSVAICIGNSNASKCYWYYRHQNKKQQTHNSFSKEEK